MPQQPDFPSCKHCCISNTPVARSAAHRSLTTCPLWSLPIPATVRAQQVVNGEHALSGWTAPYSACHPAHPVAHMHHSMSEVLRPLHTFWTGTCFPLNAPKGKQTSPFTRLAHKHKLMTPCSCSLDILGLLPTCLHMHSCTPHANVLACVHTRL